MFVHAVRLFKIFTILFRFCTIFSTFYLLTMDQEQQPGPSRQGPAKSPKGRRRAPTSSSSDGSPPAPKHPRVETPPELGSEFNPVRIDSSSQDSVVCLGSAPMSPAAESDGSVVAVVTQKSSGSDSGSDIAVPEPVDPGPYIWSETSEEEGWVADRPSVKQAQKQMDHVQEPHSSEDDW